MPKKRILLLVLTTFSNSPSKALAAAPEKLQPGMYIENTTGNGCTASFIYDGLGESYGRVFFGTAAHCVNSVGEPITSGGDLVGRVAALGDAGAAETDWALIEVPSDLHARVDPSLVGHPDMPVGLPLNSGEAIRDDELQFSGHGQGFNVAAATRESRSGVLQTFTAESVRMVGPVSTGDSGGPVVHIPSRRPLAIVTAIQPAAGSGEDGEYVANAKGPTAVQILALAAEKGLSLRLRTIDSPPLAAPAAPAAAEPSQPVPPSRSTDPAAPPTKKATPKKAKAKKPLSCRARAKRIKNPRKRRAALRRCARGRR